MCRKVKVVGTLVNLRVYPTADRLLFLHQRSGPRFSMLARLYFYCLFVGMKRAWPAPKSPRSRSSAQRHRSAGRTASIGGRYMGTGLTLAYAPVEERRRSRWELWRDWRTFPGSNGLHYNLDPRQCTLDFTLHAGNLGIQKRLQLLEFGR